MKNLVLLLMILLLSTPAYCQVVQIQPTVKVEKSGTRKLRELISPKNIRHESGAGYRANLHFERAGDNDGGSSCVLLEDGKPLAYPQAKHQEIRNLGGGRYSHWTQRSLYFSASDSSDPRTNKKRYELLSDESFVRKSAHLTATAQQSLFQIKTDQQAQIRMLQVKFTNLDDEIQIAPYLKRKGEPDLRSVASMLKSVTDDQMNDEEKAIAIWKFLVDHRYHDYPADSSSEMHDPVKLLNVYGYGFCDDSAACFCELAKKAGIDARLHGLTGHVVAEAYFNGAWHMFDPDHEVVYREANGKIASVRDLQKQPQLITATRTDPIGSNSADIASLYTSTEDNRIVKPRLAKLMPLQLTMGPGDQIVFNYTGQKRIHRRMFQDKPLPPTFGNGTLQQRRKTIDLKRDGQDRLLEVRWSYVILGGKLKIPSGVDPSKINLSISSDRKQWSPLKVEKTEGKIFASLDAWVGSQPTATYQYWVRLHCKEGDPADICNRIAVQTDFQFAPRTHAQIRAGTNEFEVSLNPLNNQSLENEQYLDDGQHPKNGQRLNVIMEWEEIMKTKPILKK